MKRLVITLLAVSCAVTSQAHVFSMSCKVDSLNGAFATAEGREKAVAYFRRNNITKLWLESYRHTVHVSRERLIEVRDAFRAAGFKTNGLITPTQLNDSKAFVCCWSDQVACERLEEESKKAAGVFDEVILDDFLFTSCTCARCTALKESWQMPDWGAFRRRLMLDVCRRCILEAGRKVNPNVHFIIKFPCWWAGYAEAGYDPAAESALLGECWIGTETRDANPDPLQACWIVGWINRQSGGRCGGGWYDPLDSKPEKFVEQARYTVLGGARESLIHCYDYLAADDPGTTPFGEKTEGGHACSSAFEAESQGLRRLADELDGAELGEFAMQTNGVSRHAFVKGGVRYAAFQNTTGSARVQDMPFDARKVLSLPSAAAATVSGRRAKLRAHALLLVKESEPTPMSPQETWYDASIQLYDKWPDDAKEAVGGSWSAESGQLARVASVIGLGELQIATGETLSFDASSSRAFDRTVRCVTVDSTVDFDCFDEDSLPAVQSDWKGGVIVVREPSGPRYYGLAGSGDGNVWRKLDGPVPERGGRFVPLRITLVKRGGRKFVGYTIGGVDCLSGGRRLLPIAAEGEVTGVACGGCGALAALSASVERAPGAVLLAR